MTQAKQREYSVTLIAREVRAIGYQRYLRKNRKKPIVVCLLLVAVAFLMVAFSPAVWAMVIYGICLALAEIIALRLIGRAERAGRAFLKEVEDDAEIR